MCKQFLFLGMGGMGMAPLACYVRQQGHVVYGFDDALSPKLEQFFEAQKIIICEQFPEKLDAVIFSTAFPWEHPWMRMARKRNLLPIGRGHFLAKLCERKKMIAITGSHGKTTTTAMLIDHLGDCDYILGGFFAAPNKLPAFYCERNSYLLCEVDESDRTIEAFRPHITVAINLEDDHIGAYGQSENLDAAFGKLFSQTHRAVVIPENNERLKRIAQSVGISPILAPISQQKKDHLSWGENEAVVKKTLTLLKGEKNPPSILFPTEYTPIFRRNQFLGNVEVRGKGMEIWADYAHHPTEIDHCIEKFQWKHGSEKVLFVFQPHRYSRTLQYAHDFAKVFEGKEVVFLPVYGAGESPLDGGTTESIGSHLSSSGGVKSIESLEYFDPTVFYEKDNMPHKILFIGAGDIFQGAQRWVARQHIASFREFLAQHSISFEENFSLKYRQSFQIDATAPLWIEPTSEEELQSIVQRLHTLDLPFLVIGHGSNLLVDDFPGVFISLKKMESIFTAEQRRVTASSELPMATFIRKVATLGWGGCESLAGIPGSLGGAIYMNAGAHYQSVFDYLVSLKFLDHSGVIRVLPRDQIDFSYRRGFRDGIILSAQFSFLKKESTEILLGKIRDKMQWRREKQPRGPNGGCMFKNLANHFAGALVEQVGLKGTSIGGAKIAEQHGNFIVNNDGNATVSDIKRLLRLMRQRVFERYGIFLEREILFASDRC